MLFALTYTGKKQDLTPLTTGQMFVPRHDLSEADKEITKILVNACEIVGIPVLDQVIIGKEEY